MEQDNKHKYYKLEISTKWNLDLDDPNDIKRNLKNKFYELGLIFEALEYERNSKGKRIISGNGHHKAQEIAEYVSQMFDRDKVDKIA